jgi:beta-galactosidase
MSLRTAPELNDIRWLGLGPWDAWPNKRSAPILGVWGGTAGSEAVVGKKATRWIERSGAEGGVRIWNDGYLGHKAASPEVIDILSEVLSRPEKGRAPDDSFPLLPTGTGEPLIGEFSINLY